jgi:hypothetical protein
MIFLMQTECVVFETGIQSPVYSEDGGGRFLRNVITIHQTIRHQIPDDCNLNTPIHLDHNLLSIVPYSADRKPLSIVRCDLHFVLIPCHNGTVSKKMLTWQLPTHLGFETSCKNQNTPTCGSRRVQQRAETITECSTMPTILSPPPLASVFIARKVLRRNNEHRCDTESWPICFHCRVSINRITSYFQHPSPQQVLTLLSRVSDTSNKDINRNALGISFVAIYIHSSVGIATGCRLDDRGVGVRVLVTSRILSSPRRPDRLWGPPNLLSNR